MSCDSWRGAPPRTSWNCTKDDQRDSSPREEDETYAGPEVQCGNATVVLVEHFGELAGLELSEQRAV